MPGFSETRNKNWDFETFKYLLSIKNITQVLPSLIFICSTNLRLKLLTYSYIKLYNIEIYPVPCFSFKDVSFSLTRHVCLQAYSLDRHLLAHTTVNISVLDANDNCPQFINLPYRATITSNSTKGDFVFKVRLVIHVRSHKIFYRP